MVSTGTSEGSTEPQGVIGAREDATQGSPASERDDQRGGGGQMRPEHGEGHGPRRKGSSWRTPGQLAEAESPARSRQVELTLDISSELHVKPGYDAPSFKEVQRIVLLDVLEKGGRGHHARQPASTCSTTSTQQVELGPPIRAIVTVPNVRHGGEHGTRRGSAASDERQGENRVSKVPNRGTQKARRRGYLDSRKEVVFRVAGPRRED